MRALLLNKPIFVWMVYQDSLPEAGLTEFTHLSHKESELSHTKMTDISALKFLLLQTRNWTFFFDNP